MKISKILKTAMLAKDIKNATDLAALSGVTYGTTARALNDENVGIVAVIKLLDYMGYELKAVVNASTGGL